MHELNAGLNGDKFATFFYASKSFYHSFVLQMTLQPSERRKYTCAISKKKNMKRGESVERNAELFL